VILTFSVILLCGLALVGAPLFAVILSAAFLGFYFSEVDLTTVAVEFYRIADTPLLVALPLFTFAGYTLGASRASHRLLLLTRSLLGWMPGGLAIVAFVSSALFTAFTGASGVTIVALGAILYPALAAAGYPEEFNLGLVTTSGSLGLLFAPSLPLILYGIVAQQMNTGKAIAINDLFLAGIFPGILMLVLLSLWGVYANRKKPIPLTPFSKHAAIEALLAARWELPLPVFVLGGIYSGFFAASEAAAVTAFYVVIVEVFIHREVRVSALPGIINESMVMVGGILLILGASLASTNFIIDAQVPMKLFALIRGHIGDKIVFLILLNLFLLVVGMLMDIFSALVIVIPLILPVAISYGIDPIHLGIIFLANMQIGYVTPPIGMNLFIASFRFGVSIDRLYRAAFPFMAVLLGAVLLITYWPGLSLVLITP
jgi:C4-dicarboxylate transporter, DctM subunit